jgi:hypothetical protein
MSRPGSCELGCGGERRLDLVPAQAHDELVEAAAATEARVQALRAAVRPLTAAPPADAERAYRALQDAARAALHAHAEPPPLDERERVRTTWWCPSCGGIDAPQPCLGICVWRPFEWVEAGHYEQARARARAAHDQERSLRALLRRAASVTPRQGQWERGWATLAAAARSSERATTRLKEEP